MGGSCQLPGGLTWTFAELRETGDLGEAEAVPDWSDTPGLPFCMSSEVW
ncbi:hypothetical protein U0070_015759 [Myodes glareolus]|uniref:Uncharacterized protein n=1 Tax=Myodes glareolus TaxID=447135 RepID=A0AAW0I760_MYOGA